MASKELKAALEAAQAAGEVVRGYLQRGYTVHTKPDESPVTEVDLKAEECIREVLMRHCPGYGFFGEETYRHGLTAENLWLVDPIDGTKSFIRGTPFFSTQIALMRAGRLVVGVSLAPAYGEIAWAEEGGGAWLNDQPIRVSAIAELKSASLSTGNLKSLTRSSRWQRLGELIQRVNRFRGYGDFVHYHLLARGSLDAVIESDVNILDIAALTVIVREAGGTFTDLDGGDVGLGTTTVLASNGALHAPLLEALRQHEH